MLAIIFRHIWYLKRLTLLRLASLYLSLLRDLKLTTMTPTDSHAGEAGDLVRNSAHPPREDSITQVTEKSSRPTDTEVEFREGDSEEMKAEWKRFFAELEIWRQKRYERFVQRWRETESDAEPPPREDKNWRDIVYNKPLGILAGTAPPVPPGWFPAPSREQIIEKERQRQGQFDLLEKKWEMESNRECLDATAEPESP